MKTRMAEASPTSPRDSSISVASPLMVFPDLAAMSLNAAQKASSKETLVRCPRSVRDLLTGRPLFIFEFQLRQAFAGALISGCIQKPLRFCLTMFDRIGVSTGLCFSSCLRLACFVQIDGLHFGPIISSGRTTLSKVSSSTNPNLIASSFSVVLFLWAVLATVVALS